MRFRVHKLLREFEERDFFGAHHQAEVMALQDKDNPVLQAIGHWLLADQSPLLRQPAVLVVLDGGPRSQVPFKERLQGQKREDRHQGFPSSGKGIIAYEVDNLAWYGQL